MTGRTFTLATPLVTRTVGGDLVMERSVLNLREPTFGDLVDAIDAAPGAQLGMVRALAARIAGLERAEIDRLSIEDGMRLMEVVQGFLPAGLTTGPTPGPSSPAPSASPATGAAGAPPTSASGPAAPPTGTAG